MKQIFSVFVVFAVSSFANDKKIAPDAGDSSTIIVQFSGEPDGPLQSRLLKMGAKLKQYMGNLNAGVYEVPAGRLRLSQMAKEAGVSYISPDRPVAGYLDNAVSSIYADFRSTGFAKGANVGVAVIDSGVNPTEDFTNAPGRLVFRADFTGTGTTDLYGHGTHVASIIGGDGSLSSGLRYFRTFRGVAPSANIVSLKVLDSKGMGTESNVIRAIDAAIALKNIYNIKVINLSLGRPVLESYTEDPLCAAVEKAWRAGITVVVAAGNEGRNNIAGTRGYGMIMSPANDPYVITVGAMKDMADNGSRTDDRIASYSSKGPSAVDHVVKPDLVAPGNQIAADAALGSYLWQNSPPEMKLRRNEFEYTLSTAFTTDYVRLSGTSMSAAMVSGAVALIAGRDPSASPDTIKARLMKTAYKSFPHSSTTIDPKTGKQYMSVYDIFTVGAGYLDVASALQSREVVPAGKSAASPTATFSTVDRKAKIVFGNNIIWGGDENPGWAANIIWGSNIIWGGEEGGGGTGGQSLRSANIIWGGDSEAVWGNTAVSGFNIIWGSNIIWGGEEGGGGTGQIVRTSNIIWGGLVDDVATAGDPR
ncbi:MAG: S8 family peptidase [Bryobacteraceae bacterium]|nr:S8 family peptidase [Bryobacteraceae bacterium]